MNILSLVAIALISASLIILLKTYAPEYALPVSVIASVIILMVIVAMSGTVFDTVKNLADNAGVEDENITLMFKALGICYITQLGKDVCLDCGQTALGEKIDLAGKITITVLSLPLLLEVLQIITKLME